MEIATKRPTLNPRQPYRQILNNRNPQVIEARSHFAVASFIVQDRNYSTLVNINRVLVVLLYEDTSEGQTRARLKASPLCFAGYGVTRIPHGIQWGGAQNNRFFKDLSLTPRAGGRGRRLNSNQRPLIDLALSMDQRLTRAGRYRHAPWPSLRLPRAWAGFRSRDAKHLRGEGPEFEVACTHKGTSSEKLFENSKRITEGLVLHPLEWVSSKLDRAAGVYVELTPTWRRQVFRLDCGLGSLIGYQGANKFDYYHSRYRKDIIDSDCALSRSIA